MTTNAEPLTGGDDNLVDVPNRRDAAAVIQAAQEAAAIPREIEGGKVYHVFVPLGGAVHEVDTQEYEDHPRRARGAVELATVESFNDYVKAHTTDGTSVWVHPTSGEVVAVLNDHDGGGLKATSDQGQAASLAGWGDFRARLKLEHTSEWSFWLGKNNSWMNQEAFAEHIEVGQLDVVEPDGAELLEIAQSIQASSTAEFRSALRLDNGEIQFAYDETIGATAGRARQLEIPATFKLQVEPFIGEESFSLVARLRYRIVEGKLSIGYKIDRPDVALRDAIELVAERVRTAHERVYSGTPR